MHGEQKQPDLRICGCFTHLGGAEIETVAQLMVTLGVPYFTSARVPCSGQRSLNVLAV